MGNNRGNVAAQIVAQHGGAIDIQRNYSMGPGGAKTLLDEKAKARQVSMTIKNVSDNDRSIVFGVPRHTMFNSSTGAPDLAGFLAEVGADLVLTDGTLEVDGADNPIVEAVCDDAGRKIQHLLEHAVHSPLRFTAISLQSANTADNSPNTTNFTSSIKTVWVSPFRKPVEDTYALRKLQTNKSTSPHFGSIDLVEENFPVILSRENFFVLNIKSKTSLSLTIDVGIEDSAPQRLYRTVSKADSVVNQLTAGKVPSCGC